MLNWKWTVCLFNAEWKNSLDCSSLSGAKVTSAQICTLTKPHISSLCAAYIKFISTLPKTNFECQQPNITPLDKQPKCHFISFKENASRLRTGWSRVSFPARQETFLFRKHPDGLQHPPSFLFNGYWGSFSWDAKLTTYLHLVSRVRVSRPISLLLYMPSWWPQKISLPFRFIKNSSLYIILFIIQVAHIIHTYNCYTKRKRIPLTCDQMHINIFCLPLTCIAFNMAFRNDRFTYSVS